MMLYLTIYKVATLLVGLAFTFMGYKLFIRGIFTEAGELRANWENRSLMMKRAAPGTFFALFGTVIVCVSLWRGLSFSNGEGIGVSPAVYSPTPQFQEDATRNLLHGEIAVLNTIPANLRLIFPPNLDAIFRLSYDRSGAWQGVSLMVCLSTSPGLGETPARLEESGFAGHQGGAGA
jgi:hypothetical protein